MAAQEILNENDFEDDFSDIDMEELDSYLTSPPEMMGASGDKAADPARAAARARLAARAAHVDGGMAAQAAAEAAVEAVAGGPKHHHSNLDGAADENAGTTARRSVFSRLQRGTPSQLALGDTTNNANANAMNTPAGGKGGLMGSMSGGGGGGGGAVATKRKHVLSPPGKFVRRKGHTGVGINVARAARDLCGDLGEPKENLMKRAIETIGVVAANDIAIEVGRIEGQGGQMTTDGARRRTPGGVFWALLKERASKEDWDFIFEEEKEVQRERCRRRRRAMSMAASGASSLMGSPTFRGGSLAGTPGGAFEKNMNVLKTPAHGLISAAAASIAAGGSGGSGGSRFNNPHKTPAGASGAPIRPTLAERLSGAAAAPSGSGAASRLGGGNAQDTPIGAPLVPEGGSWAARAKAAAAMTRTQSAPAAVLNNASASASASASVAAYSPTAAAAALSLASPPVAVAGVGAGVGGGAGAGAGAARGNSNANAAAHAMETSPAYGVVTPDNDPTAAATAHGGSWAARAKAAAEAEVAAAAQLKARAQAAAALKLASAPAPAPAPAAAASGDDVMDEDAAMEADEPSDNTAAVAAKPASIWAGMASFASIIRAV